MASVRHIKFSKCEIFDTRGCHRSQYVI